MPDLLHTLQGHDLGFLRMTAGLWGLEMSAPDAHSALPWLTRAILTSGQVQEIVDTLPEAAQQALRELMDHDGHLAWSLFSRRYGEVRSMGAARRDRERPDLKPASPAESLWYRGLIGRAFLNQSAEPQEYAYIPDDLVGMMHLTSAGSLRVYGRPATPGESAAVTPVSDRLLDLACTFLAGRRLGMNDSELAAWTAGIPFTALNALLNAAGLLDSQGSPQPKAVQKFLEAPRGKALAELAAAWIHAADYNDLRLMDGLVCEGDWTNQPLLARRAILEMLSHLPQHTWWNINAFIADVKEYQPDFQRPAGDYDSWFIRPAGSEQYYRGFSDWEAVDGRLLRELICGPLHWLGIFELAGAKESPQPEAFRPSDWAEALLEGRAPEGLALEEGKIRVGSNGLVRAAPDLARAARYQLARFCEWGKVSANEVQYAITPAALERARSQKLSSAQLVTLLRKYCPDPLPPALLQALKRWEQNGAQAHIQSALILRVSAPEVLTALRATRAGRFISEELSPTLVILKPGSQAAVLQALTEAGYLGESSLQGDV
jgi:hypothetical protein